MKIRIKHNNTEVEIIESELDKDRQATIKYSDQALLVQATIEKICEQIIKMEQATNAQKD